MGSNLVGQFQMKNGHSVNSIQDDRFQQAAPLSLLVQDQGRIEKLPIDD